jgi:hypothetical protein
MKWAKVREVAARGWELGPTWVDAVGLVVLVVGVAWWWDLSWLIAALLSLAAYAVLFGGIAWLDLANEEAEAGERTEDGLTGGDD